MLREERVPTQDAANQLDDAGHKGTILLLVDPLSVAARVLQVQRDHDYMLIATQWLHSGICVSCGKSAISSSIKKTNSLCVVSSWGDSSNVRNTLSKTDCISLDRLRSGWERHISENGSSYAVTSMLARLTAEHVSFPCRIWCMHVYAGEREWSPIPSHRPGSRRTHLRRGPESVSPSLAFRGTDSNMTLLVATNRARKR